MMFLTFNSDGKNKLIHEVPFDTKNGYQINEKIATKEQLEEVGIMVESLPPKLSSINGKSQTLYLKEDGTIEWRYEDAVLPKDYILESKVQELKDQLIEVQNYVVNQQYNNLLNQGGM